MYITLWASNFLLAVFPTVLPVSGSCLLLSAGVDETQSEPPVYNSIDMIITLDKIRDSWSQEAHSSAYHMHSVSALPELIVQRL